MFTFAEREPLRGLGLLVSRLGFQCLYGLTLAKHFELVIKNKNYNLSNLEGSEHT